MKRILPVISMVFLYFIGCSGNAGLKYLEATGSIEATTVTISSQVKGEIKKYFFEEGDKVRKGDTIVIIDDEELQLKLKQAEAAHNIALAKYRLLKNGARSEDISVAEEQLLQAKKNYEQAEKDKIRFYSLYQSKSVSKKQYEDALLKFDLMQAQFNSAKETLRKFRTFARPEELKQAEASVKQTEALVDLNKKYIRDSYVTSPINGFIINKFYEAGETVSQMSDLVKLADLGKVKLVVYVSEVEFGKVKLGQSVDVSVDAFKDKTFIGKVIYISPEAEFTPKNIQTKDERTKLVFAVKIEIENPDYELKIGMPADAKINIEN